MRDWEGIILDAVVSEWEELPDTMRPWGVWVCRFPMLTTEQKETNLSVMPEAVWFLNRRERTQRSIWEWRRFFVVQCEQPWRSSSMREPVAVFRDPRQIAVAPFARGGYYLETVWAGQYGHGWELTIEEDGQLSRHELWIS